MRARFVQLAKDANARQPQALADGLFLLMDGAYMAARMFVPSPNSPAAHVVEAALCLIEAYCEA